jgi:DNA-binding NarL/FixJ family response regulator
MAPARAQGDHGAMSFDRPLRVLVVDDHAALRAGLQGLLAGEPDLECVGTVAAVPDLDEALRQTRPDVVVLDYAMGTHDGLRTCFRVKQRPNPPAVVLYSAYVDDVFAVPAAMAQADATISKTAPASELLDAVRRAGHGGRSDRPRMDAELMAAASARLRTEDLPIASMLFGATPVAEIADTLDLPVGEVKSRALRIIGRLQAGSRLVERTPEPELPL